MILDWDAKITELCVKMGIDPEVYNEDESFMEWIARHYGFENYDSFLALASPKDVLGGMALDMLPDHKNYELPLTNDCTEMIGHNYDLYNDVERTQSEIKNFLSFMAENFSKEMITVATTKLNNVESVSNILSSMET